MHEHTKNDIYGKHINNKVQQRFLSKKIIKYNKDEVIRPLNTN